MMGEQGNYAQAEAEYRIVLAAYLQALGADHLYALTTRHNIARMIGGQGNYTQAEAEFRILLADETRVLGGDHPRTLATRYRIAQIMAKQGIAPRQKASSVSCWQPGPGCSAPGTRGPRKPCGHLQS